MLARSVAGSSVSAMEKSEDYIIVNDFVNFRFHYTAEALILFGKVATSKLK